MTKTLFCRALIGAAAVSTLILSGCSSVALDESAKAGTTRAEAEAAQNARRDAAAAALQQSGVTIMQMDEGLDTGDMLDKVVVPLAEDETGGSLFDKLSRYNLALGQKRSEAVKQRMQLLGVPASRIEAVSFGREKPVAVGENEAAWAQNRRADIVYR